MVIGVNCLERCEDRDIREAAVTINHEEVAHGINRLKGIVKTQSQEHKDFQNTEGQYSPDTNDIKNDSKYKNTTAKKQIDEIDKIMDYD